MQRHKKDLPFEDPSHVFRKLVPFCDNCAFFDSANSSDNGRYSYIAVDPHFTLTAKNQLISNTGKLEKGNPFVALQNILDDIKIEKDPDLPPFQAGLAGLFGYDLYTHLEDVPWQDSDPLAFPDLAVGFYDVIISFDLQEEKSWIVSLDLPKSAAKVEKIDHLFAQPLPPFDSFEKHLDWVPDLPAKQYKQNIQDVIDHIYRGTFSQANLTQRWIADAPKLDPVALYLKLRTQNPAPFAGYFQMADCTLLSTSPERFVKLAGRKVTTSPIKGTLHRSFDPVEDKALANQLLNSAKDNAENTMIVDLMRNDLSKVCEDHSIAVPELCALHSFETLHHLISTVTGKLRQDQSAVDVLKATFPGGSITGAPKIKAMEIITALEPHRRGPFYGSLGFISTSGDMDTNILIRTMAYDGEQLHLQVGGGIVADSTVEQEYDEMLLKAQALFDATTQRKAAA